MKSWGEFAAAEPELASFGADHLASPPSYLATVRSNGTPRVHPVTPVVSQDGLFRVHGTDLTQRAGSARTRAVRSAQRGSRHRRTGGEFSVSGIGRLVDDFAIRAIAERAASYDPSERYVLFELLVNEARCNGYGDVEIPKQRR
jgi:hypothetical protein